MEKKMSEEMTETEVVTDQLDEAVDGNDTSSTETDWKREARKWESRAKAAQSDREAAQKWREYEESLKPVEERRMQELAQAREEANAAKLQLTRFEVASEKGIPANAVKLLSGTTREDLESAADELLALIAENSKSKSPRPVADQGKPTNSGSSAKDQFAQALSDLL